MASRGVLWGLLPLWLFTGCAVDRTTLDPSPGDGAASADLGDPDAAPADAATPPDLRPRGDAGLDRTDAAPPVDSALPPVEDATGEADDDAGRITASDGGPDATTDAALIQIVPLDDRRNAGPPPPLYPWAESESTASVVVTAFGDEAATTTRHAVDLREDALAAFALESEVRWQQDVEGGVHFTLSGRGDLFAPTSRGDGLAWALNFGDAVSVTLADLRGADPATTVDLPVNAAQWPLHLSPQLSPSGRSVLVSVGCEVWLVTAGVDQPVPVAIAPRDPARVCGAGNPWWLDETHAVLRWWSQAADGNDADEPVPVHLALLDLEAGAAPLDQAPGVVPDPPADAPDRQICILGARGRHVVLSWNAQTCSGEPAHHPVLWAVDSGRLGPLPAAESRKFVTGAEVLDRWVFLDEAGHFVSFALDGSDERQAEIGAYDSWSLQADSTRGRLLMVLENAAYDSRLAAVDPATGDVEALSAWLDAFIFWWDRCPSGDCIALNTMEPAPLLLEAPYGPETAPRPFAPAQLARGNFLGLAGPTTQVVFLPEGGDAAVLLPLDYQPGAPVERAEVRRPYVLPGGLVHFEASTQTSLVAPGPGGAPTELAAARPVHVSDLAGSPGEGPWLFPTNDTQTFQERYGVAFADGRPAASVGTNVAVRIGLVGQFAVFYRTTTAGFEVWDLRGVPQRLDTVRTPIPLLGARLGDEGAVVITETGAIFGLPIDPATGPLQREAVMLGADGIGSRAFAFDAVERRMFAVDAEGVLRTALLDFEAPGPWSALSDAHDPAAYALTPVPGGEIVIREALTAPGVEAPRAFDLTGNAPGVTWPLAPPGHRIVWLDSRGERVVLTDPQGRLVTARLDGADAMAPPALVDDATPSGTALVDSIRGSGRVLLQGYRAQDSVVLVADLDAPGAASELFEGPVWPSAPAMFNAADDAVLLTVFDELPEGPVLDIRSVPLDGGPVRTLRLPGLTSENTEFCYWATEAGLDWLALLVDGEAMVVPVDFTTPRAPWRLAPRAPGRSLRPTAHWHL